MRHRAVAVLISVLLVGAIAGCGAEPAAESHGSSAPVASSGTVRGGRVIDASGPAAAEAPVVEDPMLARYGLTGKSVVGVIDHMDETNAHRGSGLNGSVRADHLLLKDEREGTETSIPIPDSLFYVSVAPYATTTHECFNHSLTGCKGEFVAADMTATVTKDDGTVLYDGPVRTFENGFIGFWLPRDVRGTMSFSYDGKSVTAPFATDAKSPTCVTTMQLT